MSISFDEAIALTTLDPGHHLGAVAASWSASGRAPGGLVEAQLLAGMTATVDDASRRPLSFTAHLLRAPTEGVFEIHSEVLRAGRTMSNVSGRMMQDGKLIATALSIFAVDRASPDFDEQPMLLRAPADHDDVVHKHSHVCRERLATLGHLRQRGRDHEPELVVVHRLLH